MKYCAKMFHTINGGIILLECFWVESFAKMLFGYKKFMGNVYVNQRANELSLGSNLKSNRLTFDCPDGLHCDVDLVRCYTIYIVQTDVRE